MDMHTETLTKHLAIAAAHRGCPNLQARHG